MNNIIDKQLENISKDIISIKGDQDRFYKRIINILESIEAGLLINNERKDIPDEELFEEIRRFIIDEQRVSTSLLERKFNITYSKACKLIDRLEQDGIISGQNKGIRSVLVK